MISIIGDLLIRVTNSCYLEKKHLAVSLFEDGTDPIQNWGPETIAKLAHLPGGKTSMVYGRTIVFMVAINQR